MQNPSKVQKPKLTNPIAGANPGIRNGALPNGNSNPYAKHRKKLRKEIWK